MRNGAKSPLLRVLEEARTGRGLCDHARAANLADCLGVAHGDLLGLIESVADEVGPSDMYLVRLALNMGPEQRPECNLGERESRAAAELGSSKRQVERRVADAFVALARALERVELRRRLLHTPAGALSVLDLAHEARSIGIESNGDPWLAWLLDGSFAPFEPGEVEEYSRSLSSIRDRVLRGAAIAEGSRVLDVGCGIGFMTDAVRRLAGKNGSVVAVDASEPVARHAERVLTRTKRPGMADCTIHVARASHIPVEDESVDRLVIRSVLMFMQPDERRAAVQELARVLSIGGRYSIFEPVTSRESLARFNFGEVLSSRVRLQHDAVVKEVTIRASEADAAIRGYDEQEMIEIFEAAGFDQVDAAFEYRHTRSRQLSSTGIRRLLYGPPNPLVPSYASTAQSVIEDPERFLTSVEASLGRTPLRTDQAAIYLWGTR